MSDNNSVKTNITIKEEVRKNIVCKKNLNVIIPKKNVILKETFRYTKKPKIVHSEYTIYIQ